MNSDIFLPSFHFFSHFGLQRILFTYPCKSCSKHCHESLEHTTRSWTQSCCVNTWDIHQKSCYSFRCLQNQCCHCTSTFDICHSASEERQKKNHKLIWNSASLAFLVNLYPNKTDLKTSFKTGLKTHSISCREWVSGFTGLNLNLINSQGEWLDTSVSKPDCVSFHVHETKTICETYTFFLLFSWRKGRLTIGWP